MIKAIDYVTGFVDEKHIFVVVFLIVKRDDIIVCQVYD